jgi:hypothetical protein
MRKIMVGVAAAAVAALAWPSFAADLPPYREGGVTYQRESHTHTYEREYRRAAPRVRVAPRVVEAPLARETVVVRRPIVVARPPVIIEEYPVYAAPVYATPRVYAYGHFPGWRRAGMGWGPRRHLAGRW